ncbi:D-aminoacylase [Flavihumibacter sediminis]|nr:D-aminoacylase [Flavihumibacter sediminis]
MKLQVSLSVRLLIFLLLQSLFLSAQPFDIIIRNGKIINGTGNAWFRGDVGIINGRIIRIGNLAAEKATKTIDAAGLIVAPGFIDVHGHIEGSILERPTADNFIYDGVTTIITGNCGGSANDLSQFFLSLDSVKTSLNIASLVGHNTVRRLAVGLENKIITESDQRKMDSIVAKAMQDGAVGLSTGLIYLPGMFSKTEEVVSLAKVAAAHQGVYASHIRSEGNNVAEAIREAINIGKEAGIPVQISHFKVSGKSNWGRSSETLSYIEEARKGGYDVTIDQYPYTASSTNLNTQLPDWAQDGGADSIRLRFANAAIKERIVSEMITQMKKNKYKNYSHAVVARFSADSSFNGKSISEINKIKGRKPKLKQEVLTVIDMIDAGGAQMIYHSMNENDVRHFMQYPHNMVGADAGVSNGRGMPHPRGYGSNARVLAKYVREEKIISLEEAIRRMTSLAAQKFNLKNRGLIMEGMAADIVVFDAEKVTDRSTFEQPHQFSEGFRYVVVNGQMVIDEGKHTGTRSGSCLYGPAKR